MLLILLSIGIGCQIAGPDDPRTDERSANQKTWDEFNDGTYSFLLNRGCFCAFAGPIWIQVIDNDVTFAQITWSNEPVPTEHLDEIETIDDIFDMIERAEKEADDLHVEYSTNGYPSVVNIDWIKEAVDDEMFLEISNVVSGIQLPD